MICDKSCEYCKYSTTLFDPADERLFVACDYIGTTGKRRPCPPGMKCTVRIFTPKPPRHNSNAETERQRQQRKHARETLHGKQREALIAFMSKEGYTIESLAAKMELHSNTIRKWVMEYGFANWRELELLGLIKPADMPTTETHPRIKKDQTN